MAILLPPQCWKARCMPPHPAKHSTWTPLTACDIPDLPMCHPPNSVLNATSAFGSCAAFHPEALDVMCAGCETFRTGVASTPRDVSPSQCNDYSHLHGAQSQAMRCWNQGSKSVLLQTSALLTSPHTHFHDRIKSCSLKAQGPHTLQVHPGRYCLPSWVPLYPENKCFPSFPPAHKLLRSKAGPVLLQIPPPSSAQLTPAESIVSKRPMWVSSALQRTVTGCTEESIGKSQQ